MITLFYASLLALLAFVLALWASVRRGTTKTIIGQGEIGGPLHRAIRAHGNLIEYAPIFLIVLALLEMTGAGNGMLHLLGVLFVVGRLSHAYSFTLPVDRPTVPRAVGSSLNMLSLLVAAIYGLILGLPQVF